MVTANKIMVEVAYAGVNKQLIIKVEMVAGSTIEAAIRASGILEAFPEIDLGSQKVGVFSKVRQLSDEAMAGDRVEIYRALIIQPMDARRGRSGVVKRKKGR